MLTLSYTHASFLGIFLFFAGVVSVVCIKIHTCNKCQVEHNHIKAKSLFDENKIKWLEELLLEKNKHIDSLRTARDNLSDRNSELMGKVQETTTRSTALEGAIAKMLDQKRHSSYIGQTYEGEDCYDFHEEPQKDLRSFA